MRKCNKCGARNDDEAKVCSLCGQSMAMAPPVDTAMTFEPRLMVGGKQRNRGEMARESRHEEQSGEPAGEKPEARRETRKPEAHDDASTERHFLVSPLGEPVKLDTKHNCYVFGRDQYADVKIPSTKVSRRHGELRWKGEPPVAVIRDLNSQNGTYVNDVRLQDEHVLDDGDTVRMGDFFTTYRRLAPGQDRDSLLKQMHETDTMETIQVDTSTGGPAVGAASLIGGDASILPINEVLKKLLALRAHGILAVEVGGAKGSMKIVDGKAVEGDYAGLEGMVAIRAMAALTKGRFQFEIDPHAPKIALPGEATEKLDRPPSLPPAPHAAPPHAAPHAAPPHAAPPLRPLGARGPAPPGTAPHGAPTNPPRPPGASAPAPRPPGPPSTGRPQPPGGPHPPGPPPRPGPPARPS